MSSARSDELGVIQRVVAKVSTTRTVLTKIDVEQLLKASDADAMRSAVLPRRR